MIWTIWSHLYRIYVWRLLSIKHLTISSSTMHVFEHIKICFPNNNQQIGLNMGKQYIVKLCRRTWYDARRDDSVKICDAKKRSHSSGKVKCIKEIQITMKWWWFGVQRTWYLVLSHTHTHTQTQWRVEHTRCDVADMQRARTENQPCNQKARRIFCVYFAQWLFPFCCCYESVWWQQCVRPTNKKLFCATAAPHRSLVVIFAMLAF